MFLFFSISKIFIFMFLVLYIRMCFCLSLDLFDVWVCGVVFFPESDNNRIADEVYDGILWIYGIIPWEFWDSEVIVL